MSDLSRYSFYKEKNLIDNIVFAILSGEKEAEAQNILSPISPIPLDNTTQLDYPIFYIMFLMFSV